MRERILIRRGRWSKVFIHIGAEIHDRQNSMTLKILPLLYKRRKQKITQASATKKWGHITLKRKQQILI